MNPSQCSVCGAHIEGSTLRDTCSDACRKRKSRSNSSNVIDMTSRQQRKPEVPPSPTVELDGYALALWELLWNEHPALASTDVFCVERYCLLQKRAKDLREAIGSNWTTVGARGQDVANPLAKIVMDTEKEIRQLEDRLGLNVKHSFVVDAPKVLTAIEQLRESL